MTLVVRRTDGSTTEFSAAGLLGYVSEGDFTRTRIELSDRRLASLGAAEVAVRIAPMVSLLPHTERAPSAKVAARDAETADGAPPPTLRLSETGEWARCWTASESC